MRRLFGEAHARRARVGATPLGRGRRLRARGLHGADDAGALRRAGDPHARMDDAPGSLEKLLDLAARDEASGLGDAPWPPHFRKTAGEAPRVAPSRARSAKRGKPTGGGETAESSESGESPKPRAARKSKMPLVIIANSPDKNAALAGLERWKQRHPHVAEHLAIDDVLVDSMRGRSSTWTRVRVNLRHVPEALRPPQDTPDPDDDPTREWRQLRSAAKKEA